MQNKNDKCKFEIHKKNVKNKLGINQHKINLWLKQNEIKSTEKENNETVMMGCMSLFG